MKTGDSKRPHDFDDFSRRPRGPQAAPSAVGGIIAAYRQLDARFRGGLSAALIVVMLALTFGPSMFGGPAKVGIVSEPLNAEQVAQRLKESMGLPKRVDALITLNDIKAADLKTVNLILDLSTDQMPPTFAETTLRSVTSDACANVIARDGMRSGVTLVFNYYYNHGRDLAAVLKVDETKCAP